MLRRPKTPIAILLLRSSGLLSPEEISTEQMLWVNKTKTNKKRPPKLKENQGKTEEDDGQGRGGGGGGGKWE